MTTPKCVPGASPSASRAGRTPGVSVVRPAVPSLTGRTTETGSVGTHHECVPDHGTHQQDPSSGNWLITDRTRPFWQHARDLLTDGNWHHRDELYTLGKRYGLAERTIANLLPRASKRRWIERSRGHVRLRDRAALEQALQTAAEDGAR